jgi:hypothetical protein
VIVKLYLAMACRKNGQEKDARPHLDVARRWLRERGGRKQGIVSPQGESVIHRAGAAVELARKEAQEVFPGEVIGE